MTWYIEFKVSHDLFTNQPADEDELPQYLKDFPNLEFFEWATVADSMRGRFDL